MSRLKILALLPLAVALSGCNYVVLAPAGVYTCSFSELVAGNAGAAVSDVASATATDYEANVASGGVPRKLGFAEIERRRHPDGPETSGESGIDVVWRITR